MWCKRWYNCVLSIPYIPLRYCPNKKRRFRIKTAYFSTGICKRRVESVMLPLPLPRKPPLPLPRPSKGWDKGLLVLRTRGLVVGDSPPTLGLSSGSLPSILLPGVTITAGLQGDPSGFLGTSSFCWQTKLSLVNMKLHELVGMSPMFSDSLGWLSWQNLDPGAQKLHWPWALEHKCKEKLGI